MTSDFFRQQRNALNAKFLAGPFRVVRNELVLRIVLHFDDAQSRRLDVAAVAVLLRCTPDARQPRVSSYTQCCQATALSGFEPGRAAGADHQSRLLGADDLGAGHPPAMRGAGDPSRRDARRGTAALCLRKAAAHGDLSDCGLRTISCGNGVVAELAPGRGEGRDEKIGPRRDGHHPPCR